MPEAGGFEPTPAAARSRLAAVDAAAYARTRNHLDGAVTRLSPYLTHGFVGTPDVLAAAGPLPQGHKLRQELGWREFFRHVWAWRGDAGILASIHEGPLPDDAYASELPADLREGRTGIAAIDRAVRELYATGWLQNHARMWLASYAVHGRKVHWRAGADWMLGHLIDGDLASNHLSWQWVAGTSSTKPYLFNAENVARFAPAPWHSAGSAIDIGYDACDAIARSTRTLPAGRGGEAVDEPALLAAPPAALGAIAPGADEAALVRGRDVWLVHPWHLADPQADAAGALVIALLPCEPTARHPWSARRWHFVGERLAALTSHCWWAPAAALARALAGAARVRGVWDPHLPATLRGAAAWSAAPTVFREVQHECRSFSQWWRVVAG